MYNSISHSELVQVCTVQISFTRNWHKYVQISISQEVGTNVYKSHSHRTPVKICTNLSLSWNRNCLCLSCSTTTCWHPPPPTLVVGRQVLRSAPHIPWDVWVPSPPPRCCRLNLRVWLAVGGGGRGGGWLGGRCWMAFSLSLAAGCDKALHLSLQHHSSSGF